MLSTGALLIVALRAFAVAEVRPAVAAPDTPAGRALSKWMDLFNSGRPEQLQGMRKLFSRRPRPNAELRPPTAMRMSAYVADRLPGMDFKRRKP